MNQAARMTFRKAAPVPTTDNNEGDFSLSIVVPARDEAPIIREFLRHLRGRIGDAELLVVDGASTDDTPALAAPWATVLATGPGRARQMNAGAAAATGDVLWFLHADSWVPEGAAQAIRAALADPRVAGGCFRLQIPHPGLVYRLNDRLGNLGVDLFRLACGDHGLFVRRTVFEQIGGYPEVPILEDVELYRRARRLGRMRQLPQAICTSPRRWERNGPWRTTSIYMAILALYVAGVPIERLDRLYRRLR
jgi:rSAM/selenodomain-associated transferase 2